MEEMDEIDNLNPAQQAALKEFIGDLDLLNALADTNRQRIIIILGTRLESGMTVNELTKHMQLSQPTVSHHLKILKQVNMVDSQKKGLENRYFLTLDDSLMKLETLVSLIRSVLEKFSE